MLTENRQLAQGHLVALGTILIWGTTYVSTKVLLTTFSPMEILLSRFIIGYFALLLIYPHRLKRKSLKEELMFMAAGLFGVTLYFLFENIALTYTLTANVGIIISIAPLLTAVLAHFFLNGEPLKPQFFAGFVIAISGIILITFNGSYLLKLNPLGDFLAVMAAVVWAVYSVIMRKIGAFGYHTIACTRRAFFYGLVFMIPALFFLDFDPSFVYGFYDIKNVLNILFLGFGASALCFASWNWTVKILGAVKTSFYIYIVPVVTIVSASLILKEHITLVAFLGAVLTLAGLFISERKIKRKEKTAELENDKEIIESGNA